MTGRLDLLGPARRAQEALLAGPAGDAGTTDDRALGAEARLVDGLRQVTLLLAGAAVQRFGTALEEQQEILAGIADLSIGVLALESTILRAGQAVSEAADRASVHLDLARLAVADRIGPAELTARTLAASVATGDDARVLQAGVRRLLRSEPIDRVPLASSVAAAVLMAGGYPA
jgi:hypothetical protein